MKRIVTLKTRDLDESKKNPLARHLVVSQIKSAKKQQNNF